MVYTTPPRLLPEIRIRDPIHGTLGLSRSEIALIDHPAFQRLRSIKQLGLADLAFPGATHTRYAHSLGTMHMASRMFDQLARHAPMATADAARLRQTLRLAALFHDLGHAPLSHTTEAFMPPVGQLNLGDWADPNPDRRASHEDYTIKLLIDSDLTRVMNEHFREVGVAPDAVAALVAGFRPAHIAAGYFLGGGVDWLPMLQQCVSSELDADRMDYLLRDSYFAGVPYGRYDHEWLIENLRPVAREGAYLLGIDARASFGFEDYLLSRYHMFMSVYFHHIPIGYEVMLRQFAEEQPSALELPADPDAYLHCDDVFLFSALRQADSEWAHRVVRRRAFRMLTEFKSLEGEAEGAFGPSSRTRAVQDALTEQLAAAGIRFLHHSVKGRLSKYFSAHAGRRPDEPAPEDTGRKVVVVDGPDILPIQAYTPLYRRYTGAIELRRIYVDPDRYSDARRLLPSR